VEDTGYFQNLKARVIGRVSLERGMCALSVRALKKPGGGGDGFEGGDAEAGEEVRQSGPVRG
jgi:hypothetical protein